MPGQDGGATDNHYYCGTSQANSGTQTQWIPWSASNVNLEYGAHLWLDAAPNPSLRGTAGCDIIAFAYLRALNEFGAYVNDVGSAYWQNSPISVNIMSDISDTYSSNPHGTHSYWADIFFASWLGYSVKYQCSLHPKLDEMWDQFSAASSRLDTTHTKLNHHLLALQQQRPATITKLCRKWRDLVFTLGDFIQNKEIAQGISLGTVEIHVSNEWANLM